MSESLRRCKFSDLTDMSCLSYSLLNPVSFASINTHSASPPQLGVAIAGTESYISAVLQPYVEYFSSKPPDWQTFLRFLLIPLGKFSSNQKWSVAKKKKKRKKVN